jgi:hypothetical protein
MVDHWFTPKYEFLSCHFSVTPGLLRQPFNRIIIFNQCIFLSNLKMEIDPGEATAAKKGERYSQFQNVPF